MAGETILTLVGNLTAQPTIKYVPAGDAVANFTVASTPRTLDRERGEWRDGDPLFLRCTAWRQLAEHTAELAKGTRVIVTGKLRQRSFDTESGTRTVTELEVDELGVSIRFGPAQIAKTARSEAVAATGDPR